MNIAEILAKMGRKKKERKEMIQQLDERYRAEETLGERRKSANQREVEKLLKEKNEINIKDYLEALRREKRDDVAFNHNPLNVKNITASTDWEVLKERNLFSGKQNSILDQPFIHKNGNNILKVGGLRLMQ